LKHFAWNNSAYLRFYTIFKYSKRLNSSLIRISLANVLLITKRFNSWILIHIHSAILYNRAIWFNIKIFRFLNSQYLKSQLFPSSNIRSLNTKCQIFESLIFIKVLTQRIFSGNRSLRVTSLKIFRPVEFHRNEIEKVE